MINDRYYFGVHKTENIDDGYMGSGILISKAIKKYGKENFKKEVLCIFDECQEAYEKERELIIENYDDPLNYNLHMGGQGGWEYINNQNRPNPMHDSDVVKRVTEAQKRTRSENKEHYDRISIENISKTWERNRGRKRPEHSKLMKDKSSFLSEETQKKALKTRRENQYKYIIEDPDGNIYKGTAKDIHEKVSIPYATLTTKDSGYIIKRGQFKQWKILEKRR